METANRMSTNATYTQLRDGSWGIRVLGTALENQTISVRKKDGTEKTETVRRVLWTGRDSRSGQTVSLCAIGAQQPGKCRKCGGSLDDWERRHGMRLCANCRDGGGNAHGGQSYYDRNGNFVLGDDD